MSSPSDRGSPPLQQQQMEEEDSADLFVSAQQELGSSGYHTGTGNEDDIGRSDTLDDLAKTSEISLDDDEEGRFKSARIESEPEKKKNGKKIKAEGGNGDDDDDEEPNPFQDAHLNLQFQLSSGTSSSAPTAVIENKPNILDGLDNEEENRDEFLDIFVTNPQKRGDGISSYMVYTVRTKTNINYLKKKDMSVTRRFSDFLGLHDKLSEKYLHNGRVIPPAPDKSMVGMAKIKMDSDVTHDEFVEKRRAALQRYLIRTAKHSSLRTDPDFREFLELETELPRSNQTSALSGKNVMKLISKVGDKVSSLTLKMEETDEWFEEKAQAIDALDTQLRKLHNSTEYLIDLRRNLSVATGGVSKSLATLSSTEENPSLSEAITKLSMVHDRIGVIHQNQSEADFYDLSELIKDYIGLLGAVKDVFNERIKSWQSWQSVTGNLTKKREAKVKAELQQRSDRVDLLRQEIAELEREQEMTQENFEKISRLIKKEIEFFDELKAKDFKEVILCYLGKMLRFQEEIATQWEIFLPEVQQIKS